MHADPPGTCSRRRAMALLVGGSAAAVGGLLAGCTPARRAEPPRPVATGVDVADFGAVGDGRTDDTVAIQRALDSLTPGSVLNFPAHKVFCHDDVLTVRNSGVTVTGPGELRATDEERSSFQVAAAGVTLDGLTLSVADTTRRWSTPAQHKLFIDRVSGVVVRDVRITGSAAAGLFALGSSDFRFERIAVSDTRADGIHMTLGAHHGTVDHPVVSRSGDDGVAVVSYLQDGATCHDIEVLSPVVDGTTGGRGLSVVGGRNVTYRDISVDRSSAASVYLACEGDPSNSADTSQVSVVGGRVTGANTDGAIDHGAVLVYVGRSGGTVADVRVSGLSISGTREGASRQIGVVVDRSGDKVSGVTFDRLELAGDPTPYQGNAALDGVQLRDVVADGRAVEATVSS